MFNHAPGNYQCPICLAIQGTESEATMVKQDDIFYRDEQVVALINSKFVGNNPGHVIVVSNEHFENIFDLPDHIGSRIFAVAKQISIALKEVRKCDGVMIFQNNGPASGQHAFHYHLHIMPRFTGDKFEENFLNARVSTPQERQPYSKALKEYFKNHPIK